MNAHFLRDDILELGLPEDFVSLVSCVSDVAMITDRSGKILDAIWNIESASTFDPTTLVGVSMVDIVTGESRGKITEMLRVDGAEDSRRYREINHDIPGVGEIPVRYSAVGAGESVIFLGREIRAIAALQARLVEAQRALDEDYDRLRRLETQYRVLFQTSSEAILIVEADTRKIVEANAACAQLSGIDAASLKGMPLETLFAPETRAQARETVQSVVSSGQGAGFHARLAESGKPLDCQISIFRAANATMMLCTLSASDGLGNGESAIEDLLIGMIGRIPDAMVLTDEGGRICWCNDAFLGSAEIAVAQQAEGQPLSRFLGRPGVDIDIIVSNALEHGHLRAFSSVLTGAYGSETRVEISVAALMEQRPPMIGFVMRDISRYDQIPARRPERNEETSRDLMNLVGSVPLKELVRASTEEIEKMCIETALRKTGNNRASAAEMLGLSRQSFYVKLRRFGLLESDGH